VSSQLDTPPEAVWQRIITFEGVNDELMPIVRMTAPKHIRSLSPADVTPGERLFRSWILLFGVVPIDYDDVTVLRIEENRGFLERSPMLTQKSWEHERTLEPRDGGTLVTDRIEFVPKLPGGGALKPVFRAVFRHRHRRHRKRFGGRPA
jgi:ligand-binding SRPBCC domain-containing protein